MPIFLLDMIDDPDDRELFRMIYDHYSQLLFYQANLMLDDEQKSEDALTETFTRLAKHFQKTDKKVCQRMKHFLVIINRNVVIDMLRKDSKEIPVPPDSQIFESVYTDGDEGLLNARLEEAAETIERMPDKYRDVLYMKFAGNVPEKDIAILLGISEDAVYKRLERGRAILTEELDND